MKPKTDKLRRPEITVVNSKTSNQKIIKGEKWIWSLNDDLNGFPSTHTMIIKRPIAGNKYCMSLSYTHLTQIALKGKPDVC